MRIGIAGFGVVGQAVYSGISEKDTVIIYDKYKGIGKESDLLKADCVFICLPTPTKGGSQITSEIESLCFALADYTGLLIIKSTILSLNRITFPKRRIVSNPEFLNQIRAEDDFLNQSVILLGGDRDQTEKIEALYRSHFSLNNHPRFIHCSVDEAISAKYVHNLYHAFKVLFWNHIYKATGEHRKLFRLYSEITGNTNEMANVGADGRLGFGGACFPKDVAAWDIKHSDMLTQFMLNYNETLRLK